MWLNLDHARLKDGAMFHRPEEVRALEISSASGGFNRLTIDIAMDQIDTHQEDATVDITALGDTRRRYRSVPAGAPLFDFRMTLINGHNEAARLAEVLHQAQFGRLPPAARYSHDFAARRRTEIEGVLAESGHMIDPNWTFDPHADQIPVVRREQSRPRQVAAVPPDTWATPKAIINTVKRTFQDGDAYVEPPRGPRRKLRRNRQ